jgi:GTPase Era involved in 16S rRNA processing
MRERLVDVVERAELAVASSSGVVSDDALKPVFGLLKTIRARMSYPDDVLIVALAGGTGSGKSSLFNALLGEELADVGGIRPTTSEAAASVPESAGSRFDGFLDHIGIEERHSHSGLPFCLIDLPDTDSIEEAHRHRVDQLLPVVDVVVWVTDPEKYRDARLHHDYLRPLSRHSQRFVVVLNQMDRLAPAELDTVIDDLGSALEADGLSPEAMVPVAASPRAGPPIGIEELVERLESMRRERDVVSMNLMTDLASAATSLAEGTGGSINFDARAADAVKAALDSLEAADTSEAASNLTAFLDGVAADVGGPGGQRISRLAADVPAHVARIAGEVGATPPRRRWLFSPRPQPFPVDAARSKLNGAVIRPARSILAKRAVALASIADLAVEIASLSREAPR